jgi:7,8-dihydroneopterin aldolase/epimerase/oxygenase
MATISLEGMKFHAYHGVYEAEKILGTDYLVDVSVKTSIKDAAKTDDVEKTINYETIYQICDQEMLTSRNLIETVVKNIINKMKYQFPNMDSIHVIVRKLNPPLGGRVYASVVEDKEDFNSTCPNCKKDFICYKEKDLCWCKDAKIHPATLENLKRQFNNKCLCSKCLTFFGG